MFDKIPIWFTWKNCCLFEYQNIKCIHLWLFTLCLKHIIFFKVGISQLSYPSTKIAYLPGCTRIFYSDVSIRVKNNLISITRQRGAIVHEEWWHPLSWTGNTLCISQCPAQPGCVWVCNILGLQSLQNNCAACHSGYLPKPSSFYTKAVCNMWRENKNVSLLGAELSTLEGIFCL